MSDEIMVHEMRVYQLVPEEVRKGYERPHAHVIATSLTEAIAIVDAWPARPYSYSGILDLGPCALNIYRLPIRPDPVIQEIKFPPGYDQATAPAPGWSKPDP